MTFAYIGLGEVLLLVLFIVLILLVVSRIR